MRHLAAASPRDRSRSVRSRLLGTLVGALVATALAGLAACSSPEERAEAHYQKALAYLAEGDAARAAVELRTVFRLDADHEAARLRYAALLREEGNGKDALAQYQLAAEQHPSSLPAQRAAAELALELQDLETATQRADRAFALAPQDPEVRGLKAGIDWRRDRDRPAAVAMARAVVAERPELVAARMVLVADRLAARDLAGARAEAEAGIAAAPQALELHLARVALLEEAGDTVALGDELARMAELFPDDPGVRAALVEWHLRSGDPDRAEAVLRAAADAPGAAPEAGLTLAQFLYETRGPEAARAELDARVAATPDAAATRPWRRALAALAYQAGDRAGGIAAMRSLAAEAPGTDAGRDLEVGLAEMLADEDDPALRAESAGIVQGVLAADATHLAALKLDARLAIAGDRAEAAVRDMRTALTVAPHDPEVMTLTALAHERLGQRALMGEQLALAVEASNRGQAESLRYAGFLLQDGRDGPAEGVVVDALRRAPQDPELLQALGRIHLARRDFARAGQTADLLRQTGDPAAAASAEALDAARLQAEGRTDEGLARLEALADAAPGDGAALAALVRARVAAGEAAAAEAWLDARIAADPGNLAARSLKAGLAARDGRTAEAEALYRGLVAAEPGRAEAWQALFELLAGAGRAAEAEAALEAGITAAGPANGPLVFARAGVREARGDLAGAILDYETLYARSSADPVVANNLASLLAGQVGGDAATDPATDPAADSAADSAAAATLERAWTIARRLQTSDVPEFRDTLGWIAHLRGDDAAALAALGPAGDALPGNALVQFHRAEVEAALGRTEAARASYARALAAAAAGSPLPASAAARAQLAADPSLPHSPAKSPAKSPAQPQPQSPPPAPGRDG